MADFVVSLDFPGARAYFESIRPRHPARRPNLEFGIGPKEGRFYVRTAGAQAAALGIKVGDEIIAIDGKSPGSMEIWALRDVACHC